MSSSCQKFKIRTIPHTHLSGDIINFYEAVSAIALTVMDGLSSTEINFNTWANTYSALLYSSYTTVGENSACWEAACAGFNFISSISSEWLTAEDDPKFTLWAQQFSSLYDSAYNTVNQNSAVWNLTASSGDVNVNNFVYTNSADILNIVSTVEANSAQWAVSGIQVETDPVFSAWAQAFSAAYQSTYNTVLQNSSVNWNYQGTDVKLLTSNWQIAYTNLLANSSAYLTSPDITLLQTNSAGWELVESIVQANSSHWSNALTAEADPVFSAWAQAFSANFQGTYNSVSQNSANWETAFIYSTVFSIYSSIYGSVYNTVNSNSAVNWNYQGTDVKLLTANWQVAYTNLISNSASYLTSPDITLLQSNSAGWENIESVVITNSAQWAVSGLSAETDPKFTTWANTFSADLQSTKNTVFQNSAINWNYQGTDVKLLTANWQLAYTNVTTNSAAYLTSPDITLLQSNSAGWESVENVVQNNSAYWSLSSGGISAESDPKFTLWAQEFSAFYDSTYNTVNANSSIWNLSSSGGDPNVSNFVYTNSADILNIISTVETNSAQWAMSGIQVETDPVFSAWANTFSAAHQSTYNTVLQNSAVNWNYQGTDVKLLTANWQLTFNNVTTNSASYLTSPDITLIQSNSAGWENIESIVIANSAQWAVSGLSAETDPKFTLWANTYSSIIPSTYNTVNINSAVNWNYQGTDVKLLTANWESTRTTVSLNSANWNSTRTTVSSNSANWNSTRTTVLNNSANWNSTRTTVSSNSANWNTAFTYSTIFSNNSALYNSVYTTVNINSAINWNYQGTDIKSLTSIWQNAANTVSSNSANWNAAFTNLVANSAAYLTSPNITLLQSNSAGWESTESTVNSNSAVTWNYQGADVKSLTGVWQNTSNTVSSTSSNWTYAQKTAIGATLNGGGTVLTSGSKGSLTIPYNAILNNVTVTVPQSGSIVIDVRKGTYSSFPSTSSIAGSNKPTITSGYKYFDGTLNTWTKNISAGDIIEYVIDSVSDIEFAAIVFQATKLL